LVAWVGGIIGLLLAVLPAWRGAQGQMVRKESVQLALPGELPVATGYTTQDALGGLSFRLPVCIAAAPGENDRLFVVEKTGNIIVVTHLQSKPTKQVFLDIPAMLKATGQGTLQTESECGVLGLAFHPKFAENGYFYVTYDFSINENGGRKDFNRVSRFRVSRENPEEGDPQSEVPLITQLDLARNHDGGDVHFGADGYLYYSMGDEGAGNDQFDNARFVDKDFFAAIYRLDVDQRPGSLAPNPHAQNSTTYPSAVHAGAYRIPADNPFIGAKVHGGRELDPGKIRTEIWATGLRNPWRFSFDPPTGRCFIGDVGQNAWEEIDLGVAGGDYGWSYLEGTHNGPRAKTKAGDLELLGPIYEYPHGRGSVFSGDCVIGGLVYRGSRLTELYGQYIFSDFTSRRIWSLREEGGKWLPKLLGTEGSIAGFGIDPRNGDLLMADHGAGKIKRLVRTGTMGEIPPALLSMTGAFADMASMKPAEGLVTYTPNVGFWSDYAIKQRWFSMGGTKEKMTFSRDGHWGFPAGMVWVKHFDMEMRRRDPSSRRRLETRFLVKTATGVYGITYKWRADQSDADLVAEDGLEETFDVQVNGTAKKQTWHYPSRAECLTCHTAVAGEALSFNTAELNRSMKVGGKEINQIQALSDGGYFAGPVTGVKEMPAFAAADDKAQSLEWRVRSYLAVNCAQCHQPGGAVQGNWDARATTPTQEANLIGGWLANDGGDAANRWLVAGDVGHSMVLKRLQASGTVRMPPLATHEIDSGGIELMTQWIKALSTKHETGR